MQTQLREPRKKSDFRLFCCCVRCWGYVNSKKATISTRPKTLVYVSVRVKEYYFFEETESESTTRLTSNFFFASSSQQILCIQIDTRFNSLLFNILRSIVCILHIYLVLCHRTYYTRIFFEWINCGNLIFIRWLSFSLSFVGILMQIGKKSL